MKKNITFIMIFSILFLLTNMLTTAVSAFPHDGLAIYYPFNGNADDESGNGNNGTVNGATLTSDGFGNPNSAYSFNGENGYIENNTFQDIMTNITITAWIKYESYLPDMYTATIIAKADNNGNNAGFTIHLKETENNIPIVRFIINDNDGGKSSIHTGQITINKWYFVTASYDGARQSIFLNGCLVHSTENSGTINPAINNLLIGKSDETHIGGPVYFHGLIDDIRIYKRALSESEIQELYCEFLYGDGNRDMDGDGINDAIDNCPEVPNPEQSDLDWDRRGDACDNCPYIYNSDQADINQNQIGDACEELFECQGDQDACQKDLINCHDYLGKTTDSINNGISGLEEIKQLLKTPPGKRETNSYYEGELGDLLNRIIYILVSPPGEAISRTKQH